MLGVHLHARPSEQKEDALFGAFSPKSRWLDKVRAPVPSLCASNATRRRDGTTTWRLFGCHHSDFGVLKNGRLVTLKRNILWKGWVHDVSKPTVGNDSPCGKSNGRLLIDSWTCRWLRLRHRNILQFFSAMKVRLLGPDLVVLRDLMSWGLQQINLWWTLGLAN